MRPFPNMILLLLAGLASPAAAQGLDETQRVQRCAANRDRIAALERDLGRYPWTDEQFARVRATLAAFDQLLDMSAPPDAPVRGDTDQVYGQASDVARDLGLRLDQDYPDAERRGFQPQTQLKAWLEAAERERPRNDVIRTAIAAHRTNLTALACDELAALSTASSIYGSYSTDWGQMEIGPAGATYVYGTRRGMLDTLPPGYGTVSGTWRQDGGARDCGGGQYYGRYTITFTAGGFTGQFGYCDDPPALGWSGTRQR